jgi:hypothetical protein
MTDATEGVFKIRVLNGSTQSNEIDFTVKPAASP